MAAIDTPRPTPHAIVTSLGPVDYVDAGSGPPVLLLHGLHMDHSLWEDVVEDLARDHRCIVPTLPLGAQRQPVLADHLQIVDVAGLIGELLDRLDLQDVTAVGNDTGGAILQLFLRTPSPRLRRIALVACEAFDNLPPGLPGSVSALAARLPGGLLLAAQSMRFEWVARLPVTWGWMTRRGVPASMRRAWFASLRQNAGVRRDTRSVIRSIHRGLLQEAAGWLTAWPGQVLIVWAADDRVMPRQHYHRLLGMLPHARGVLVENSRTLIPLDQPTRLAATIREFGADTVG